MRARVKLFLASSNPGKLGEYRALAADAPTAVAEIELMPGFDSLPSFEENAPTFAENAAEKALHYSRLGDGLVFADDSGLVVPALGGAPGVRSARFAGIGATDAERIAKLIGELGGKKGAERAAYFLCAIALAERGRAIAVVTARADGEILETPRGTGGFGYDPVFYFPALEKTFAELSREEKNQFSHRGKAFRKMLDALRNSDGHGLRRQTGMSVLPCVIFLRSMATTKANRRKKRPLRKKSRTTKLSRTAENATTKKKTAGGGTDPKRVVAILEKLDEAYPDATCELKHENPFQLLISTILSAQCTDVRVNQVAETLYRKYPTPEAFAYANPLELEQDVRPTGFFRNKTKSIMGASKAIIERFGGQVPRTMEEMLTLPGAARKTANVVLGTAYGIASGIVVDTHVIRISNRLDLTRNEDPKKIEQDLMRVIPKEKWIPFSHQIIWHGRRVCQARKPKCVECNLEKICYSKDKTI